MENKTKVFLLKDPVITKVGDYYIAESKELRLICPGATEAKAEENLKETIKSLIKALSARGILDERLKELGIENFSLKEI